MQTSSTIYPIYDLSNDHFRNVEIITKDKQSLKGQFVKFALEEGDVEYLYPSGKYCFLPEENKKEFWEIYRASGGIFKTMPKYIHHFSLADLHEIIIHPTLL